MPQLISTLPFISKERSFGSVFFWAKGAAALGLGLLCLAWLVPNHYRPWPSFHSEMVAAVGLTLLVLALLLGGAGPLLVPRMVGWLASAMAVVWLQWVAGITVFFGDALTVSLYLLALAAAVVVGYTYAKGQPEPRRHLLVTLMALLIAGASASATIGMMQWFGLEGALGIFGVTNEIGERAIGNLAQANHLSTLLLMGCAALVYLYETRRLCGLVCLLIGALLGSVLVLTASRSGLVGILVIAGYLLLRRWQGVCRIPAAVVLALVAAFLAATWALPYLSQVLLIGDRGISLSGSSGRIQMWKQIGAGIAQQPWWGYGWNQTVRAQMAGAPSYPSDISTDYAHNVLLDLLAWNGIPLGLVFIAVGTYWLVSRMWRARGLDAVFALAVLLPFLVHSLVEYPFAYNYFLLPVGMMAGVIEASLAPGRPWVLSMRMSVLGLACWVTLAGYFVYEYFLIEEDFRVTRFEGMRIGKTPVEYEPPSIHLASHMAAMLRATRYQAKPQMNPVELAELCRVGERFGYGVLSYRYALALALNGEPDDASRVFAMIRAMYGPGYYAVVRAEALEAANGRWPELKAVKLP